MTLRVALLAVVACGSPKGPAPAPRAPAACGAPLPAPTTGAPAAQLIQVAHGATVTDLAVSADGYLATYSQFDNTVRIWDLRQRSLLAVLQEQAQIYWDDVAHALVLEGRGGPSKRGGFTVIDLLVGPDGRIRDTRERAPDTVAVRDGGVTRTAALKRGANGGLEYTDAGGRVVQLAFTGMLGLDAHPTVVRGGGELVAREGSTLHRWSLPSGKATTQEIDGEVSEHAVTPTGDTLVVHQTDDGALRISLYSRDGAARTIAERDSLGGAPEIAVAGSFAVISSHEALVVHELASGKVAWQERGAAFDTSRDRAQLAGFGKVAVAPDGHTVIAARSDGSIALRDLRTGRNLGELGAAVHQPTTVAWLDDRYVLASNSSHVIVWDLTSATIAASYVEPRGFVHATVIGNDVVVARMTNCFGAKIEDARTIAWIDRWSGHAPPAELVAGKLPALRDGCASTTAIAWPPARGIATAPLVLGGAGDSLDLTTGNSFTASSPKFLAPHDSVKRVDGSVVKQAFSITASSREHVLRGNHVFAPILGKGVGVWRIADGTQLHLLALPWLGRSNAALLDVAADGSRVAVRTSGDVAIFDAATGTQHALAKLDDQPTAIAFGTDPKEAWIGTRGGKLHHLAPDGNVRSLGAATGAWITRIAVSPDRRRIVALGDDGGLRVLDAGGRLAATLVGFADEEPLSFTPGGAYAGSAEAADRIAWRFENPTEVFRFEQFARQFARPELVAQRLAGGTGDVDVKLVRPPTVELVPAPATTATATTRIEVKVASTRRVDIVRAYREGREVASANACAAQQTVTLDVPLLSGTNTITVQAFDDLGHASNAAVARITRSGGPQPELYVVAIGVGSYPNLAAELQLPLATADAKGIAEAFAPDVGPGKRFAALHPQVLLDGQATGEAALAALDRLAAMKEDDLAIVSFAGHGVKPSPADDMLFVTGTVASLDPDGVRAAGIAWPAIAAKLARAKGRVVVLLDACHSGHVSQNLVVPNDRLAAALARDGRAGVIVFAASKGRQSSYEPGGVRALVVAKRAQPLIANGKHGFFTGALLTALRDPASDRNGDGALQMSEWIHATRERVTIATEGLQTPWVARQEMFGDFAVVPLAVRP